jgi:hypothetical protein
MSSWSVSDLQTRATTSASRLKRESKSKASGLQIRYRSDANLTYLTYQTSFTRAYTCKKYFYLPLFILWWKQRQKREPKPKASGCKSDTDRMRILLILLIKLVSREHICKKYFYLPLFILWWKQRLKREPKPRASGCKSDTDRMRILLILLIKLVSGEHICKKYFYLPLFILWWKQRLKREPKPSGCKSDTDRMRILLILLIKLVSREHICNYII